MVFSFLKKIFQAAVIFLITVTVMFMVISLIFSKDTTKPKYLQELCGLNISGSEMISYEDSHGGFHGDGTLTAAYDCSQISDSIAEQTAQWKTLPLTDNLQEIMYNHDSFDLAKKYGIPEISNGCYFFKDRHSESDDPSSDENLLDRYSLNFSLVIYDGDNHKLYLFEFDT